MGGLVIKILGSGGAVVAGLLAKKVVTAVWEKTTGKTPPDDPKNPEVRLREAVGWAVLSGVTIAVAQLLAQRGAARVARGRAEKANGSHEA